MIGFLRGLLLVKKAPSLLLDVHGVGYELDAPMSTFYQLPALGEEVTLYTHLVVREDAHTLFGFIDESERTLFRSLLRVNGIGARLALTILSGISVDEFQRSVRSNDTATLVRLPGIGKKTAERLIIEMRDRLPQSALSGALVRGGQEIGRDADTPVHEAISALIALGFKQQDASAMVREIPPADKTCEDLIRLALQAVAR
jgi:Holliday junction DNA helicase RuvA